MNKKEQLILFEAQIIDDYITSGQYMQDHNDDIHTEDDAMNFIEHCTIEDVPLEYQEERLAYYSLYSDNYLDEEYDRQKEDHL